MRSYSTSAVGVSPLINNFYSLRVEVYLNVNNQTGLVDNSQQFCDGEWLSLRKFNDDLLFSSFLNIKSFHSQLVKLGITPINIYQGNVARAFNAEGKLENRVMFVMHAKIPTLKLEAVELELTNFYNSAKGSFRLGFYIVDLHVSLHGIAAKNPLGVSAKNDASLTDGLNTGSKRKSAHKLAKQKPAEQIPSNNVAKLTTQGTGKPTKAARRLLFEVPNNPGELKGLRKFSTSSASNARIASKLGPLKVINNEVVVYPTPLNLNYAFNFGSLAGVVLLTQILTGILLAMHYTPHIDLAFSSVVHIMNDVPGGLILRYGHANGASLFFVVTYLHVFRGIYYSSGNQPRELVWITGVFILLAMIITAFIGYVLPFGQMSLWGATVITSLATVIPVVGKDIVTWLWGGFSIDNPTLNRFYSLHYTLPFVLAGLSIAHISYLHQYGSTNPLGVNTQTSTIPFGTYFATKDLLGVLYLLLAFSILVFFYPEALGHPDNLIPANPYVTPQHIVPEWYFLWVYAILRSIPNKAAGVIFIGLTFASLIALPFLSSVHIGSPKFRMFSERFFWVFVADVFLLTWVGAQEIMPSTVLLGQVCTFVLFVYLLVIYPILSMLESHIYLSHIATSRDMSKVTPKGYLKASSKA